MKLSRVVMAAVALVVAGAVAWFVQRESKSGGAAVATAGAPAASPQPSTGAAPAAAGGRAGGPGGPPGPAGPVAVEVGVAVESRVEDDALAVGTIRSRRSVILRPEVSGRVAFLGVTDGARVRKDQLLLQLDDTLQQAQLKQAQAQANIAQTNLQRSRELASQNFVSQSAVDQNAAALDVAQAQVALMQAQITRTRVLAPFDAIAGIRSVQVGDYLKDGADVVTLDEVGAVYLDFRLPERYVPQIKPGRMVEAQLDALPSRRFTGVVTALDSQIDVNGRALLVRAELRNADGALKPGMFARARIVFGSSDKAVLVPEEALVPLGGKQFFYKVVAGPKGPVAQRVEAKLGLRRPGQVQILEGVAPGEQVVTAGHARLERGDRQALRIVDIDKPTGPPRSVGAAASAVATTVPSGAASKSSP